MADVDVPALVAQQLARIRETAQVNMFDAHRVYDQAIALHYTDLTEWMDDHVRHPDRQRFGWDFATYAAALEASVYWRSGADGHPEKRPEADFEALEATAEPWTYADGPID